MFKTTLKKLLLGVTAVATVAGATAAISTPADAAPWGWHGGGAHNGWRGDWRGHGWGPGPVIGAGLLGLAVGASLSHPYYGPPPGAYQGPGYWGYYNGCRSYWRWSPGWGRYVRVERCY